MAAGVEFPSEAVRAISYAAEEGQEPACTPTSYKEPLLIGAIVRHNDPVLVTTMFVDGTLQSGWKKAKFGSEQADPTIRRLQFRQTKEDLVERAKGLNEELIKVNCRGVAGKSRTCVTEGGLSW